MIFSSQNFNDLKIGGYVNYTSKTLGLDTLDQCFSKEFFLSYPYDVLYTFNDLGFRDIDSINYTNNPIIVLGDSFTVGLGVPDNLTYPKLLEKLVNFQVLNFAMNGASNEWIARKLKIILKFFNPVAIIVHYTFSHRREKNEPSWFDDERTLCDVIPNDIENYNNWSDCHTQILNLTKNIPTFYSFVPNWHPNQDCVVQVDFARDYFHYGIQTNQQLANFYADCINQL